MNADSIKVVTRIVNMVMNSKQLSPLPWNIKLDRGWMFIFKSILTILASNLFGMIEFLSWAIEPNILQLLQQNTKKCLISQYFHLSISIQFTRDQHLTFNISYNKIKNLLGPIYQILDPWCQLVNDQLTSLGQLAAGITWPMSSRHQLANLQLISVGKRAADITWPMSSWHQLANEQLTSFGQWADDVSRPRRSWDELAN